jgi:CBS domain-containing protein
MVTDDRGSLVGRVHAVDLLKLIMNKRINRDLHWMEAVPISQAVSQPPLQVRANTPLMVAATLMLTHDLNQIAVTDAKGSLVGYVSHAVVARHLPRFLL